MNTKTRTTTLAVLSLLLISFVKADNLTTKGAIKDETGHLQIPLQIKTNIKAVYQISDDSLSKGTARSLTYAKKLLDIYNKNDVADNQVDLHLVFHGQATNALVDSNTRKRLQAEGPDKNPNQLILAELIKRGVKIELCQSSMQQRNVTNKNLLTGVTTVIGAYPRLIELQMLGYAYIKFE